MNLNKYKNIQLTNQIDEANCITHSGKFHVDDVISTIFLSKIIQKVILLRVATVENKNLKNKISPDFIKLCNPEWNEDIYEDEAFINALKLADEFWNVYIKHAIAEVEAIEIILDKMKKCKDCYLVFDKEMPYRKAVKLISTNKVKYMIFKSRREGYDIRTVTDSCKFKNKIVQAKDINISRKLTGIEDLIYIDVNGKLCCTKTLESAIRLVRYNEGK